MKKLIVPVLFLFMVYSAVIVCWNLSESKDTDGFAIPDIKDLRIWLSKDTFGAKIEADGTYTFTDAPTEAMEIYTFPSSRRFKKDGGYEYGPGMVFPSIDE
jgi:hypothetical protein